MKLTQEQIEHLRTIQETSSFWADVAENQLPALADKIDNIDLTPIENKVDEGVSTLSDKIDNIDLSAVENKVQEESAAIQGKIDNIKLPEVDLSNVAKQGENQEATMSAVMEELMKLNGSYAEQIRNIIGE
jgi:hypothetical protein